MPEFIPTKTPAGYDEFLTGYLNAVEFTECHADNPEMQGAEFSKEFLEQARKDCAKFTVENYEILNQAGSPAQNGTDFWFTRNGHGVGFWDRGYPTEISKPLTKAAHSFGELCPYVGDDGLIYA